jgi:hypothetical protein
MKLGKVVLVMLVVVALVFGYWAFIGFREPVDDFTNDSDTNDSGTDDDNDGNPDITLPYVSYGTFHIVVHFMDYEDFPVESGIDITPTIKPYTGPSEGKVYRTVPGLYIDSGDDGGTVYPVFDVWVEVQITGPGAYLSNWKSRIAFVTPEFGATDRFFDTGRAFFPSTGSYTISVTEYSVLSGSSDVPSHSDPYKLIFEVY